MKVMKNNKTFQPNLLSPDENLKEAMKHSFEFWQKHFTTSLVNYPLVWKKALESNSELMKKIENVWKMNAIQNSEMQMQQFFEMWAYAIRKSNFEITKNSVQYWENFWKNTTDEQFRIYKELLQMIEKYWTDIQNKNF